LKKGSKKFQTDLLILNFLDIVEEQSFHFDDGTTFTVDIYIPSALLAFECQGKQHYTEITKRGELTLIQSRDNRKREALKKLGVTLIEIPYWWKGKKEELHNSIHFVRPDLCPKLEGNGNGLSSRALK